MFTNMCGSVSTCSPICVAVCLHVRLCVHLLLCTSVQINVVVLGIGVFSNIHTFYDVCW